MAGVYAVDDELLKAYDCQKGATLHVSAFSAPINIFYIDQAGRKEGECVRKWPRET